MSTAADRDGRRRWPGGHRARVTAAFTVAAAVVSATVGLLAYTSSRAYLQDQRERVGRDRAYVNARVVRDQLRGGADPGEILSELAPEEGATALLRVDDTWFSSSVGVDDGDVPVDVLAEVEGGVAAWQVDEVRGAPHLAVAVPIRAVDVVYAEVIPLTQLQAALDTMRASLAAAAAITTAAGAIVGFVVGGRLVRPLRRLAARAEAIASGEADALEPVADADLQPLVASLNRVIERYSRSVEERSRFASDVSHEIRGPLAALSAAIDVMQRRRKQLPSRSAEALDILSEQVNDFQQLVVDLLEISRIDAGRAVLDLEPTDPELLARGAVDASGARGVEVHVDDDLPPLVLLDRRRMGQVLVNLLENAGRYAGGAVALRVERSADLLRIVVDDSGPGVPLEERTRIFGRFERGEHGQRGPSGTGLGLALVAEHVALHRGRVFVTDSDRGGASFVVEVPLCEPA